ncbi:MAG: hypothetical protein WAZ14_03975 [Patescibacteria group bacterium]
MAESVNRKYSVIPSEEHLGGKIRIPRYTTVSLTDKPESWTVPDPAPFMAQVQAAVAQYYMRFVSAAGEQKLPFELTSDVMGSDVSAYLQKRAPAYGIPAAALTYAQHRLNLAGLTYDESVAGLCDLAHTASSVAVTLTKDKWSDARMSMDAGNVIIESRPDDPEDVQAALAELQQTGCKRIRDLDGYTGRCPDFSSPLVRYRLGVCSVIWLEDRGQFMITRRGRAVNGLNTGRVCAASGAVNWRHVEAQTPDKYGRVQLQAVLHAAMEEEAREEIADIDWEITPIGAARELTRRGSPEFFYILQPKRLRLEALLEAMSANTHPGAQEVDDILYLLTPQLVRELMKPEAAGIIHPKGLMNLGLARGMIVG